jgi:hypothetical protein
VVSRAGLEPATTALKDQNGLIAGVLSRDFPVHYGNSVSVPYSSVRPFGHRLGHNGLRRTARLSTSDRGWTTKSQEACLLRAEMRRPISTIEAGADAVVRTGPHVLNGIEIYKGKPIFYSLGSLFFPFGRRRTFTTAAGEKLTLPDESFETVVPVTTYEHGRVSEIRLYPAAIDTGSGPAAGSPCLAPPEQARRILERMEALSMQFGTLVHIENGVGVIKPSM